MSQICLLLLLMKQTVRPDYQNFFILSKKLKLFANKYYARNVTSDPTVNRKIVSKLVKPEDVMIVYNSQFGSYYYCWTSFFPPDMFDLYLDLCI